MFAKIETKDANIILINIPHEGAEKSLPALARMLEENCVFIKQGYTDANVIKPEMSIILGDSVTFDFTSYSNGSIFTVKTPESMALLDDSFQNVTPEVMVSNRKALEAKEATITKIRAENTYLKQEIDSLKKSLSVLAGEEEDA